MSSESRKIDGPGWS